MADMPGRCPHCDADCRPGRNPRFYPNYCLATWTFDCDCGGGSFVEEFDWTTTKLLAGSGKDLGTIKQMEKQLILQTLEEVNGNKTEAARRLGISTKTIYSKLKEYGCG